MACVACLRSSSLSASLHSAEQAQAAVKGSPSPRAAHRPGPAAVLLLLFLPMHRFKSIKLVCYFTGAHKVRYIIIYLVFILSNWLQLNRHVELI